jgi:2-C-methyl-D-erythritol 4-phosphate cytidylyltransferase
MAQTPQAFQLSVIREAYKVAKREGRLATDDASLVEALGKKVHTIEGDRRNIKITTPEDLAVAEAYLRLQENEEAGR